MFDQIKMLGALMKNGPAIREKAEQFKRDMETRFVEGQAGGGAVRVTMSGRGHVVSLKLDPHLFAGLVGGHQAMAEKLIAEAVNDAIIRVQQLLQEEVRKATGGMNIPGLENMLGG
jgi:DNA-binding YbaB/EbfC family protein